MRILGLDPGEKRIGVAISDALGITAQPLTSIQRSSLKADIEAIRQICETYQVEHIVLGLPLNLNGSRGEKAAQSAKLAQELKEHLSLEVTLWDERLSTKAVQGVLLEADTSRRKRKRVVDKLAAAYILQGYLDRIGGSGTNRSV
ncbi:MAG TPA: Holliday junction resolvase RuvX [Syntrophothermus lipocalidus]|uniref:Putative pre-16S rRNA nuclease n=1 Tax=Syntrophothermus lipocalidus (strain DSM 12680 / TGB-C1) TaxID=643648 RepID=D7CK29_SYNLT|nr:MULTISPECIES: Holliday junction resolvase RuvX [Syntrophothermus]ADI01143.1 Holliday junction resolvase YqgF [Syntrophothermus lipocalidus DSM 12680]NSW81811.1 Holliday junction resolvase RuvX [Syntrophothermus sp.]HHV77931.1 Holliday junction resolvase RuvX [Syntrophothermus lipocalidus]